MQLTETNQPTPFGHEMRQKHFLIDPSYHPMNHGNSLVYIHPPQK